MCDGCTPQQISLMNAIRQLWEQHVYWTRFFHHQYGGGPA